MAINDDTPTAGGLPDFTQMSTDDLKKWAQGLGSASNSAQSSSLTDSSNIYLGQTGRPGTQYGPYMPEMTYAQARTLPTTWTDGQLRKFVNTGLLKKVPGFDVGMGMPEIVSAWDDLVKSSFAFNQAGGKKWTPMDVLNTYSNSKGKFGTTVKDGWEYDIATGQRIAYVGKTTKTSTNKQVNLSSAADVKVIATQALTSALGRAPTAKEVAQFKTSLNALETKNPSITTTTAQYTPDLATGSLDQTSSSSTTTGGISAAAEQQAVVDKAKETPEYGKYQAATTYWNAMMQMMTGG